MNPELYFMDVNIPMYAAGTPHPYREACAWILSEVAEGNLIVAIDTEIIQEILYRYGALKRWGIATTMANSLLDLVPEVFSVTYEDVKTAVSLFTQYAPQGIKARDILHAAVMQNHELTQIISTDKHFDLIPGIIRHDPLMLFSERH